MLIRFLRWMAGYVLFIGIGGFPEKFMNLTAKANIQLWHVVNRKGNFKACVAKSQYRELRHLAKRANMRLRVKKKKGFPFFARRYRRRFGLFAGIAVFFGVLAFLSTFVWVVNISGNVKLTEEQVSAVLEEIGIRPGVKGSDLQTKLLEQEAMVKLQDVSWMSINLEGSVVNVLLKERDAPPDKISSTDPCNLIASYPGQVVRLAVTGGVNQVEEGDAILQGQLLVSGVFEDTLEGKSHYLHSSGEIIARTRRKLSVEVPLSQTVLTPTSDTVVRRKLGLFGLEIPLSLNAQPGEDYQNEEQKEQAALLGNKLPLELTTQTWTRQEETVVTLTEEEAREKATEELKKLEEANLKDKTILQRDEAISVENGVCYLTVSYFCEENIAMESPLLVEPNS